MPILFAYTDYTSEEMTRSKTLANCHVNAKFLDYTSEEMTRSKTPTFSRARWIRDYTSEEMTRSKTY